MKHNVTESILHHEIFEQPEVIHRFLKNERQTIANIAKRIVSYNPRYVVIAARGTSDNAARYAQYLFGSHNKRTVALATPSLYSVYKQSPDLRGALVIGISQSGQSPDIVQVVVEGRAQGALTIAITNDIGSPLALAADHVINLHAGKEMSIAATKTYTAQLTAMATLSTEWAMSEGGKVIAGEALDQLSNAVAQALQAETQAKAAAELLAKHNRCVVLGRGFNYATAFETSLKIKELTYVLAEPYSTADFKHGPIAMIEPDFPVVMISVKGPMQTQFDETYAQFKQRGANVILTSDSPANDPTILVNTGLPEWLTPIAMIVPGQLLAYFLAFARGLNPDSPRTISKVTLTK
jgi:glucosamine--fructose-6-phosphate aminotransferase (isomerizing)